MPHCVCEIIYCGYKLVLFLVWIESVGTIIFFVYYQFVTIY